MVDPLVESKRNAYRMRWNQYLALMMMKLLELLLVCPSPALVYSSQLAPPNPHLHKLDLNMVNCGNGSPYLLPEWK